MPESRRLPPSCGKGHEQRHIRRDCRFAAGLSLLPVAGIFLLGANTRYIFHRILIIPSPANNIRGIESY